MRTVEVTSGNELLFSGLDLNEMGIYSSIERREELKKKKKFVRTEDNVKVTSVNELYSQGLGARPALIA